MKLQKAIEVKENHQHLHPEWYYQELLEADKLSIEALKYIEDTREITVPYLVRLLPGED